MSTVNHVVPDEILYRPPPLRTTLTAFLRGLRTVCHLFYGMLLVSLFPLLKKPVQHRIVKYWSRKLLDILHVGLETHGCYPTDTAQGSLLVANHVSWLDAVALNAVLPACFVAKSEIGDWPLLGRIFHGIHTLFTKRNLKMDVLRINHQITQLLGHGEWVALFPQGTTTDGRQLGHFHSSLFQGAIEIEATICPVAIRYHDGGGKPNFDAAFVGDMTFIQSLWKILCSPALHITLMYLPALLCAGKNRRMLAAEAQSTIYRALTRFSFNPFHHAPDDMVISTWCDAILPVTRAYFINS